MHLENMRVNRGMNSNVQCLKSTCLENFTVYQWFYTKTLK